MRSTSSGWKRLVDGSSQGRVGTKGVTFLARWSARMAMDRGGPQPVPSRLGGVFRYGDSADQFDRINRYARMRMATFIAKRPRRTRRFGWYVVAYSSPNQLGLIDLHGIVAAPRPSK